MNEKRIKFIDKHVGKRLVDLWAKFNKKPREFYFENIDNYNSFLVIRPGGIGDAALLLPLIRVLKNRGKSIDIICMGRNKGIFDIFKKLGYINNIYLLNQPSSFFQCKKNKYDCVLETEQAFYISALFAKLINPKLVIGFDTNDKRFLYNYFVNYRQEEYEAQSFLNLLKPFDLNIKVKKEDLFLDKLESNKFQFKSSNNLVIFAGASIEARKIPVDFFRNVLKSVEDKYDQIYIIGTKGDFEDAEKIKESFENAINVCGTTSLAESISILQNCKTFIGSDSGPLHMAVLGGVKNIIGIFGPGIDTKWALDGVVKVVKKDSMFCRPCNYGRFSQTPMCPYGFKCIRDLKEIQVIEILNNIK